VYELAKSQSVQETTALDHGERTALMHNEATSSTDDVFRPLLDQELEKIVSFYIAQEKELFDEVEELTQLVNRKEEEGLGLATATYSSEDDSDDDDGGSGFGTLPSDGGTGPPPARSRKRSGSRSSKAVCQSTFLIRFHIDANLTLICPTAQDTAAGGSKSANGRAGVTLQRSSTEDYDADLEASVMTLDGQAAGDYDAARKRRRTISLGTVLNPPKDGPGRLSQLFRTVSTVPETIWNAKGSYAQDNRMLFKRRITRLYISVTSLKSYVELNYSGFRKMLKKCGGCSAIL
jgi:phosphate transporter